MRKVLAAAGAVLAALMVVAGAAWFWIDYEARAAVDQIFANMRQTGADAGYEDLRLDLLSQSVEITGVRYESADPVPTRIAVARIAAEGLPLSTQTLGARRLTVEGVDGAVGGAVYRAPLLEVHDAEAPVSALRAGGADRLETLLAAISARQITVPELTLTAKVGRETHETSYRDITLDDLERGRIAEAVLLQSSERGRDQAGKVVFSRDYGQGRIEGLDLAALSRAALARSEGEAAYARIFERFAYQDGRISGPNGLDLTVGRVTVSGGGLKAGRTTLPEMAAIFTLAQNIPAARAQRRAAETIAEIMRRLRFDSMEAVDVSINGQKAPNAIRIARFGLNGYEGGHLASASISGLEISAAPDLASRPPALRELFVALTNAGLKTVGPASGPIKLGTLTLRGVSYERMLDGYGLFAEKTAAGEELSREFLREISPKVEAFTLSNAEATLSTGARASLANFAVTLAKQGTEPMAMTAKVDDLVVPLSPGSGETSAQLISLGVEALNFGVTVDVVQRTETSGVEIREATLSAEQLGALTVRAIIDGLPFELAADDPEQLRASFQNSSVQKFEFTFANSGAVERGIDYFAKANGESADQVKLTLPETVRALATAFGGEQIATQLSETMRTFVADPRTLTLTLSPPRPMTIAEISTAIEVNPLDLFSLMTLSVNATQ